MSELSPEARAIVDAARGLEGPSREDQTRNRAAVFAQVGIGTGVVTVAGSIASTAGAGTATAAGAGAATSAAAGSMVAVATGPGNTTALLLVKVAAGLTVVGSLGAVAVGPSTRSTLPRMAAQGTISGSEMSTPTRPTHAPASSASPPAEVIVPSAPSTLAPARVREAPVSPGAPAAPAWAFQAARAPGPGLERDAVRAFSPLSDETKILRAANDARLAGDPGGALALLDSYAAEFPRGSLREEAAAARVLALCDSGRPDASAAADAFLREFPRSPLSARVRHACGVRRPP